MDSGVYTHAAPSHEDTSTEYGDHMARLGVYRAREKPVKPEKMECSLEPDAAALDALDALDDDDDAFMREYRAKRINEMISTRTSAFGTVVDVTRETFVSQVTEPSAEVVVVVFLTRNGCVR